MKIKISNRNKNVSYSTDKTFTMQVILKFIITKINYYNNNIIYDNYNVTNIVKPLHTHIVETIKNVLNIRKCVLILVFISNDRFSSSKFLQKENHLISFTHV